MLLTHSALDYTEFERNLNMKSRFIIASIFLCFVSLVSFALTSVAYSDSSDLPNFYNLDQVFQDLSKQWYTSHNYPEYYCGQWINEDNEYCIAVTYDSAGKRTANKIKRQCLNKSYNIYFFKYNLNELHSILDELYPLMQEYHIAMGISEKENRVVITFDEKSTEESRNNVKAELVKRYGDKISVNTDVVLIYRYSYIPEDELD